MVQLRKYPFLLLLLIFLGIQVESDASDHRYSEGDTVPFYANKIGPYYNSRETYAYYELPFCSQDVVKENQLNLGEMLNGDRLVSTPYKLEFLVDKDLEVLCNKTLSKTDVSKFRRAIEKNYYMQLHYDDLPIWAFIGLLRFKGNLNGSIKAEYSLYRHFDFEVFYNKDQVIKVILQMASSFTDITEDKEVDVGFTYSVKWTMTQQSFDRRMEIYIDSTILPHNMPIHHHSITFSSVTLLILIVSLLTFYLLVLRKDISKSSVDVEEDQVTNNQEEIGWKNVHGDVYRFPQHKSLLAAALGAGSQLLVLTITILALGLLGVFQPYMRGVFWNALIIVYALTSLISGYTSVSFYCQLEGTNWLAVEDHQWWWRSFLCGGSTGLYIYVYCIHYYFERSNMNSFMQISFFFGYMACVCFGIFLVLGSVGFRASLLFVRYLYASIKCD